MPKLPTEHVFFDCSDYGRVPACWIAAFLKNTAITPIHVTIMFIIAGIAAIFCIVNEQFWGAAFFLILKSILDAADGELARVKNTPSYTGRYFDSVADIILNFCFLYSIYLVSDGSLLMAVAAFFSMQLQGTLYNYYYVIYRNLYGGDKTSRIFEDSAPSALPGERQRTVDIWFGLYQACYSLFDKAIYLMDKGASDSEHFPKWFMTAVSVFGLGFQLLIMSVMLCIGWDQYIIPFFIIYSVFVIVFIVARKLIASRSASIYLKKGA